MLQIDGKRLRKIDEVEVGALPEGLAFNPDGTHLYVGNFIDRDISILRVHGSRLIHTGKRLKLPGQPASMRSSNP